MPVEGFEVVVYNVDDTRVSDEDLADEEELLEELSMAVRDEVEEAASDDKELPDVP